MSTATLTLTQEVRTLEEQVRALTAKIDALATARAQSAKPAPVVKSKPALDMTGAPTASKIDMVCESIMRDKDAYRGEHIHPIVWSVGFRVAYRHESATPAQVSAIQKIVCADRKKYAAFFA